MKQDWENGNPRPAEEYLASRPELQEQPELAMRVIHEEYRLRQERGEPLLAEELFRRFPQWKLQIETLFDWQVLLQEAQEDVDNPFRDVLPNTPLYRSYKILAELGQGGQSTVYLALQKDLDNRPVVLKVSPCEGREHLTLAQLQHANIVPLYTAHDDPANNIRLLCMPYYGGVALDGLLRRVRDIPVKTRTGADLVSALDQIQADSPVSLSPKGPIRTFLQECSWSEVVCWLVAGLADGLDFAHERGVVHFDVKPGNVLITHESQPMLLDFQISQMPVKAGTPVPGGFGGTPAYFSPEQERAIWAGQADVPAPNDVDGRTDIYSLGLILFEMLQGSPGKPGWHLAPIKPETLDVSPGLQDILRKALEKRPANRYSTARMLADDLRCHLNDQPLSHVPNRSWKETGQKWRKRNPAALSLLIMGVSIVLASLALSIFYLRSHQDRKAEAESALVQGREQFQQGRYSEAVATLERGLENQEDLSEELRQSLNRELNRAQRAELAQRVHKVTHEFRLHVAHPDLMGDVQQIEKLWNQVWNRRNWLLAAEAGALDASMKKQAQLDYLDLALLWVELTERLAPPREKRRSRTTGLHILTEAKKLAGPSCVLAHRRRELAKALGEQQIAKEAEAEMHRLYPHTVWEHYVLGRSRLQDGKPKEARELFERAMEMSPQSFWPHFYGGLCAWQMQDYQEAESQFRTCIALAPKTASCHYNRGLAQIKLGQHKQAIRSFSRALKLDPELHSARFNRGRVYLEKKSSELARADFEHVLTHGYNRAEAYYGLALTFHGEGNPTSALEAVRKALQVAPDHAGAKQLQKEIEEKGKRRATDRPSPDR